MAICHSFKRNFVPPLTFVYLPLARRRKLGKIKISIGVDRFRTLVISCLRQVSSCKALVISYQVVSCINTFHLVSDRHDPRHFLLSLPTLFRNFSREHFIVHRSALVLFCSVVDRGRKIAASIVRFV